MYAVELHQGIGRIISLFYRIGIWHRGDEPTTREQQIKFFYCIYHLLFPLSLVVGAINSDNYDDSIFSAEIAFAVGVLSLRFSVFVWKQKQILELLNRICVYPIRDHEEYTKVNEKLGKFMKFATVLIAAIFFAAFCELSVPFIGSDKKLFIEIGFPLDWKNNEIAFWMANFFIFTEIYLTIICCLCAVIIWYLMLHCSLRYEVLGSDLQNMGLSNEKTENKRKFTDQQKHIMFLRDLKASIEAHLHIRDLILELDSFCSNLFSVQLGTSGLCICLSIYCLAFDVSDNLVERIIHVIAMFYNISDIFMITYFGNEIMLSSDSLSYSLFESEWMDQSQSTKKCIIIFGEYLKQPHQLIVGKLYPLTLETFTKILNSAYSMFNILKNTKVA